MDTFGIISPIRPDVQREFWKIRKKQSAKYGNSLSDLRKRVGEAIFECGFRALIESDVLERYGASFRYNMRVVQAETGSSKSTSCCAFIAACCRCIDDKRAPKDDFSAAYIVPTIKLAVEINQKLKALMPRGEKVGLWTSQESNIEKSDLADYRVVIVTHEAWRGEMRGNADWGIRNYLGVRRKVLFVDEMPDIVNHIHLYPSEIQKLLEAVIRVDPSHIWTALLREVVKRMNELLTSRGQRFEAQVNLIQPEMGAQFEGMRPTDLRGFVAKGIGKEAAQAGVQHLHRLCEFLVLASKGQCFFNRQNKSFNAYDFDFKAEPGYVFMDATAGVSGLTHLRQDAEHVDGMNANYQNLNASIMPLPQRWRKKRKAEMEQVDWIQLGKWVESVLLANTNPGDKVLVYGCKAFFTNHGLDDMEIQGRTIRTENYGAGIGRNEYKDCNVVVLVDEYYPRRDVVIAQSHSWSGRQVTNEELKLAEGQKVRAGSYSPQGMYGKVHEGVVLRWIKQAAMRGSARELTQEGTCGPMKLIILTSDLTRVIRNWDRLFPDAPRPETATSPIDDEDEEATLTGREQLALFLMRCDQPKVNGKVIEAKFGIPSRNLARDLKSPACQDVTKMYGWDVAKAKEVGEGGRGNWLVNWTRLGKAGADAGKGMLQTLDPAA